METKDHVILILIAIMLIALIICIVDIFFTPIFSDRYISQGVLIGITALGTLCSVLNLKKDE